MKLTNKQFTEKYLKEYPVDQVLALLMVIKKLLTRHQLMVFMQGEPLSSDEDLQAVVQMTHLLKGHHKCTITDLSMIIRILKQTTAYTKDFTLSVSQKSVADTIDRWVAANEHKAIVDLQESSAIGVVFSGDGRMYKRTLKTDLHKLLT